MRRKMRVIGFDQFAESGYRFGSQFIAQQLLRFGEFGVKRAQEILSECKAEVKPGPGPDGSGDRTKDIS